MRTCSGKEALIADNLVVAQQDMMDGVLVIELISLESIRAAKIVPAFLVDENVMAEAKGPIQQVAILVDISSVDNCEHVGLLRLPSGGPEFRKFAPFSYGNK